MNKRLKARLESDKVITIIDTNGKIIIHNGKLTQYGKRLQKTGEQK